MVKPLHAGLAARNGVLAVQLAAAGLKADPAALDGNNGFVDVFRGEAEMPAFTFGGALEIDVSGIGIKRYPCCGCTHSALDALLAMRAEHGFGGSEVEAIHCTMNGLVPDILVHHRPTTPAQAKFSMEYCLAVAVLDGACGLDRFDAKRVAGADVQDLLTRVTTSVDPAIVYRNGVYPGTVTVTLKDGRRLSRSAEEALGHPDRPLSTADLEQKFVSCATRALGPERTRAAFAMLAALEDVPALPHLIQTLTSKGVTS
jgi:2-methylcitrate dehydratase PrpD